MRYCAEREKPIHYVAEQSEANTQSAEIISKGARHKILQHNLRHSIWRVETAPVTDWLTFYVAFYAKERF